MRVEMKSQFVFQRNSQADLPVVKGGEGCFLIDEAGRSYLDGSGGRRCLASGIPISM